MDLGLRGKVAMLTGASEGIARATAYVLAAEGVNVSLCARKLGPLEEVARDIAAKTGVKTLAVQADMTKLDDIRAFTGRTVENFGRVDILVNSAGASPFAEVLEMTDEQWATDMDLKFLGYVRAAREVAPIMIRQGGGVIINVIGAGGKMIYECHVSGGAGNSALMLFTVGFATEVGKHNVRVVGINPGPVKTARWGRLLNALAARKGKTPEEINQEFTSQIPLGRICEPEDVGNLVAFLASDRGAFVNGTVVTLDGGMSKAIL
jgi:3-oxoacyl-[acyl-carrier protein] reductase